MKKIGIYQDVEIDNRWVVPFNPILLKMFQSHINVEWCHSVKSIKYICKYIHKGSDQAVFQIQKEQRIYDEIEAFQLGRYISSNEAAWRIFGFNIHERYPAVVHLSVHLENGQRVIFNDNNFQRQIMESPKTTLTAFFDLCKTDSFARTLIYSDLPTYYTWNKSSKSWQRRKKGKPLDNYPGIKADDALGRVYTVHPNNSECFYLRLLLHIVRGPLSFKCLKT